MWGCPDNQDVGLEAAIIERVRNSLLVDVSLRRQWKGAQVYHRSKGIFSGFFPEGIGRGVFLERRSRRRESWWSSRKYECRHK
jgi:hypothetical protein